MCPCLPFTSHLVPGQVHEPQGFCLSGVCKTLQCGCPMTSRHDTVGRVLLLGLWEVCDRSLGSRSPALSPFLGLSGCREAAPHQANVTSELYFLTVRKTWWPVYRAASLHWGTWRSTASLSPFSFPRKMGWVWRSQPQPSTSVTSRTTWVSALHFVQP